MNIVKFQDIVMTPEVLVSAGYVDVVNFDDTDNYVWTDNSPFKQFTIEEFCEYFNNILRNKYAYAIHWTYILPMAYANGSIPTGDQFNPGDELNYVNAELVLLLSALNNG